jgi:flavin reductase (DIM6/NTAB) family NADH-FMN oxidoreductase RutF
MCAEVSPYDTIDLSTLGRADRYKILTGAVVPRPIAFVTTLSSTGVVNAAPFSQFVIVAVDPGLLGISIGPSGRGPKDTLNNIRTSGEFVVNMVPGHWAGVVQAASVEHPADVSEVDLLGLDLLASSCVKPPRLAESDIQFECRTHTICEFGDAPNFFAIGEVVRMHVRQGLAENSKIDPQRHRPLARIGGRNYVAMGEMISIP